VFSLEASLATKAGSRIYFLPTREPSWLIALLQVELSKMYKSAVILRKLPHDGSSISLSNAEAVDLLGRRSRFPASTPVKDGLGSDTSRSRPSERRGGSGLIRRCGEAHVRCMRGRNHTARSVSRGGAGVNGISLRTPWSCTRPRPPIQPASRMHIAGPARAKSALLSFFAKRISGNLNLLSAIRALRGP
jgi:hypothetical protein